MTVTHGKIGSKYVSIVGKDHNWNGYTLHLTNNGIIQGHVYSSDSGINIKRASKSMTIFFDHVKIYDNPFKITNNSEFAVILQNSFEENVMEIASGATISLLPNSRYYVFADSYHKNEIYKAPGCLDRITGSMKYLYSLLPENLCSFDCKKSEIEQNGYFTLDSIKTENLLGNNGIRNQVGFEQQNAEE